MQKTMIKSILAVAVVGAFSATAFAAMPSVDNGTGVADVNKINNNFTTLDNSKLDKSTYANNVLLVNSKLAEKVDTATFNTKLNATASTLQGNIDTNKANIAANKANIDKVNEKADLANRANDVQNKQIAGLQSANLAQDKLIAANKTDIATNKADIATNKADIATNKADIATNKADIATNKADIASNKTNIKANTNDIHKLQNNLLKNEFHDHAQDQNIGVNKNNIEKNKANIEANKNAIAANYAEMKNNFAAVNSRIDKLDDKMKKGFAAQAALNGLFQPYSVGKFNVTAAIGGYDSEQAMALGTGYRFNENFALKAGIASDLSGFDHVTYNIGANFEF